MIKKILTSSLLAALLLSGCATNEGPEYSGSDYNQIKKIDVGTITSKKPVIISDNGSGKFLGAIVGGVLGSTVGGGDGEILAILGGGLLGGYAGSEIGKANADELIVKLESGENIVVVVKGRHLEVGDKVRIIKDGNKVDQVDKI
jgi:outer membrane lipoprotein SlyB